MNPRIVRSSDVKTKAGPASNFGGQVMHESVFVPEDPSRLRVSKVTFLPGGRTNWHQHAVGQILYVLSGVGRYQMDGHPIEEIRSGDTVVIPPNTRHWHGAAPDQMMCHLALSETDDQGNATTWLDPVDDGDYVATPK